MGLFLTGCRNDTIGWAKLLPLNGSLKALPATVQHSGENRDEVVVEQEGVSIRLREYIRTQQRGRPGDHEMGQSQC